VTEATTGGDAPHLDATAIRIVGLEKAFGAQRVLRGVDLDIARHRITVIIGRSGEGKSVLLKHILGLLKPDQGDVLVDGASVVTARPAARRRLLRRFGMLFQNAALFDSMTVFENVAFPVIESGRRLSRRQLRDLVAEKLAVVGLSGIEHKLPSELSGGMRKRVGLARAIALDPEILLYDEPTTGLDPVRTHVVDELIVATGRRLNVTSVVISHDMQAVFEIADRVVMLHEGKVLAEDAPEPFRRHPSPIVQAFIHGRPLEGEAGGVLD
jgi:phospholipid/cholesterol/gamma-HCH transport system ATP-binding protein